VELPEERLTASFNDESVFELTPAIVGPSITKNSGIIGEAVDLSLEHIRDMRRSTLLFHLTQRLLYTKWRDPGEEPKLYLFGQLNLMILDSDWEAEFTDVFQMQDDFARKVEAKFNKMIDDLRLMVFK
jgi:hypothetical protein